jgi:hypothetical protein
MPHRRIDELALCVYTLTEQMIVPSITYIATNHFRFADALMGDFEYLHRDRDFFDHYYICALSRRCSGTTPSTGPKLT